MSAPDSASDGELLPAALAREAARDAASAPARSMLVFAVTVAILTSVGLGELQTTARVLANEASFIQAGGFTVVASNEEQSVDTAICLKAAQSPGVRHVAALGRPQSVVVATASHTRFHQLAVNRDAFAVIAPGFDPGETVDSQGGWIIGGAAATELGLKVGGNLTVQGVTKPVAAVVPESRIRLESLSRSLMTFDSLDETIDRCVLDLDRATFESLHGAMSALFAHAGKDVTVGQFYRRDPLVPPPAEALAQRPTRRAGIAGALVIGAVVSLSIWTRRTDVAVRRSVGMTRSATTALMAFEHALLLWPATTAAVAIVAVLGAVTQPWLPADQLLIVLRSILIGATGGLLIMIPAALVTAHRSNAATLKDR